MFEKCATVCFALLVTTTACANSATPTNAPSVTLMPSLSPTTHPSVTPLPTQNPSPTILPTASLTAIILPVTTPTSASPTTRATDLNQICADLLAQHQNKMYVQSVESIPPLVWDSVPRQFRASICNARNEALVPTSRFVTKIFFPGEKNSLSQTASVNAQLTPGLHTLTFSSWTPGFENHVTICAQRPLIQIEIDYTDQPAPESFQVVPWVDGKTRVTMAVQCAGNYP